MIDREKLLKAKQAIILGDTVIYKQIEYKPVKLIWSIIKGEEQYSVQLVDFTAKSTTIDVRLQDLFKE